MSYKNLEILWDTQSLRNRELFDDLHKRLNIREDCLGYT